MQSNQTILDEYFDRQTLAKYLQKSEKTIQRWEHQGKLPATVVQLGSKRYYRKELILQWLQSQEKELEQTK